MPKGALVTILALISCDLTSYTTASGIKQFVNKLEPVWTVRTTRRALIKCEMDQVLLIRPLSSTFRRRVFLNGTRRDFQIYGVFDTEHLERMTVIERDTFIRVEKLEFLSRDQSCAVIKVESLTDWHEVYYDLRVTDMFVRVRPLPACRNYFKQVIGNLPSLYVYNPQCHRLMGQES
ncbi:hypothetical protein MRX96_004796 [Rhipicephalus microplus]